MDHTIVFFEIPSDDVDKMKKFYGDLFGWSVSLSGDSAVVGAQWDDDAGESSGSAYVFELGPGGWTS